MTGRRAPRYQGRITTWKDDQGFGFITPHGGGPAVFVHIKSFTSRADRPVGDDIVTYHLTANDKGQPRAEDVAFMRDLSRSKAATSQGAPWSPALAGFLIVFCMFLAANVIAGRLPLFVAALYPGLSVLAMLAYRADKAAARADRWRTPESHLHLLALAGGWPGALLAQKLFRHKSKKASFQAVFWVTVAFNCIALWWLQSTPGMLMLRTFLALVGAA